MLGARLFRTNGPNWACWGLYKIYNPKPNLRGLGGANQHPLIKFFGSRPHPRKNTIQMDSAASSDISILVSRVIAGTSGSRLNARRHNKHPEQFLSGLEERLDERFVTYVGK
jgi:hypothetical protein